jgi:hypothetical protein
MLPSLDFDLDDRLIGRWVTEQQQKHLRHSEVFNSHSRVDAPNPFCPAAPSGARSDTSKDVDLSCASVIVVRRSEALDDGAMFEKLSAEYL